MRILCEQEVLNEAVSVVSRAVSSRSSLPVLEGVYIKASDDGKVKLTETIWKSVLRLLSMPRLCSRRNCYKCKNAQRNNSFSHSRKGKHRDK